jgi:hypothetical protein
MHRIVAAIVALVLIVAGILPPATAAAACGGSAASAKPACCCGPERQAACCCEVAPGGQDRPAREPEKAPSAPTPKLERVALVAWAGTGAGAGSAVAGAAIARPENRSTCGFATSPAERRIHLRYVTFLD